MTKYLALLVLVGLGCGDSPLSPSTRYLCQHRDALIATEITPTHPILPGFFDLSSGENVYLNWFGVASHHTGPDCEEIRMDHLGDRP